MSHYSSFDTPDAFLYIEKEHRLRGIHGEFGEKIMSTLESIGIHTYGDLLDYAKRNHFSNLPGIGTHGAETLRIFIQDVEEGNKHALEAKLHRTQDALEQETTHNKAKSR